MSLEVGMVLEGKVTGITKFGAFVSLPDGKSGLVHISEIANTFVNDVHEHIQEGQTVKVRVIGINEAGKINLSIKRAVEDAPQERRPRPERKPVSYAQPQAVNTDSGNQGFEDRLKKFMQESEGRIADNPIYSERKQRNRRK